MTRGRRVTLGLALAGLLTASGMAYLSNEWSTPHAPQSGSVIVEVPRGLGTRAVLHLLHEQHLIGNETAALAFVAYSGDRGNLKAGEYQFDRPMTLAEVVGKLARGSVYLHRFTVPEGLTVEATAAKWEEQGFGKADDYLQAAHDSAALIRDLDASATTVEGYLFPDTYFFRKGATPRDALAAMTGRFRAAIAKLKGAAPWPLGLRDTVIMASLVETEALFDGNRPLIASVYVNRLKKRMLLQCDPTVIYALEKDRRYQGRLTLADLKYPSPYNTYLNPGLPPAAIASPGYASLQAAVNPANAPYLYFVRGAGGRHVFTENVAAHNRAVAEYRAMQQAESSKSTGKR